MKLYKVLNGTKAKDNGNFDYADYLPKKGEPGKWTPVIKDIVICNSGYHLTEDYCKWLDNGTVVYEAEGKNEAATKEEDKHCFQTIRLLKVIETNKGKDNSGLANSGDKNSGDKNSGNWNSGNWNSGNWNSGNRNSGNWNSGDRNSGNWNSGDRNSGNWNSGYFNSGNWNSGYRNSGDCNSGNWNSGDRNSGYFNTNMPQIRIFNKETTQEKIVFPNWMFFDLCVWINVDSMTEEEKTKFWWYKTTEGYLRTVSYMEAWKLAFDKADNYGVKQTTELPNFDYGLFEEITGITKAMIEEKLK